VPVGAADERARRRERAGAECHVLLVECPGVRTPIALCRIALRCAALLYP